MNVVIYGAKEFGKYVLAQLKQSSEMKVVAFADSNLSMQGKPVEGLPVIGFQELSMRLGEDIDLVIVAILSSTLRDLVNRFYEKSIYNVFIVLPYTYYFHKPFIAEGKFLPNAAIKLDSGKTLLYQVETHVADHCNLKCRSCSHFSNLVTAPSFPSLSQFEKDILALRQIFEDIGQMLFLGGEPFLNPRLTQFIEAAKSAFPFTSIWIYTNGLLIKTLTEDMLQFLQDNNIFIHITLYQPTIKSLPEIEKILQAHHINYILTAPITKFQKNLTIHKRHDPFHSKLVCDAEQCVFLRNGYLSKCPIAALANQLNQYYSTQFFDNSNCLFNIHDEGVCARKLLQQLSQPIEFCKYCAERIEWVPWQTGKPELNDWIINE